MRQFDTFIVRAFDRGLTVEQICKRFRRIPPYIYKRLKLYGRVPFPDANLPLWTVPEGFVDHLDQYLMSRKINPTTLGLLAGLNDVDSARLRSVIKRKTTRLPPRDIEKLLLLTNYVK